MSVLVTDAFQTDATYFCRLFPDRVSMGLKPNASVHPLMDFMPSGYDSKHEFTKFMTSSSDSQRA